MSKLTIVKDEKNEKGYIVISKAFILDKTLSSKAKGMLLQLLSLPPSWKPTIRGFESTFKESHGAITRTFEELRKEGYLQIKEISMSEYEYIVHEVPIPIDKRDKVMSKKRKLDAQKTNTENENM